MVDDELWVSQLAAWAASCRRRGDPGRLRALGGRTADHRVDRPRETPLTYDFWGFPEHYYEVTYAAPGAPELAADIEALMPDDRAGAPRPGSQARPRRLRTADRDVSARRHPGAADLAAHPGSARSAAPRRAAAPLRDDGVLIIGSGFTTHGLPFLDDPSPGAVPPDWSMSSTRGRASGFAAGDVDSLIDFRATGPRHAVRASHHRALLAAVRRARCVRDPGQSAAAGDRRLLDGPGQTLYRTRLTRTYRDTSEVDAADTQTELLLAARTAHERRDWHASYEAFTRAGQDAPLSTDDLDAMAFGGMAAGPRQGIAAGPPSGCSHNWPGTDPPSAAMKAVDLALAWLTRGDLNIGQGWMNRARRCSTARRRGPAHGYLAYLDAAVAALTGDRDTLAVPRAGACARCAAGWTAPRSRRSCHVAEAIAAIREARTTEAYGPDRRGDAAGAG